MKKALVIAGGKGSGKSSRARVEATGRYAETNYNQLYEPFGLSVVLRSEPDTVIVDDMPNDREAWEKVKQLITNDQILINTKNEKPRFVDISKMNFIFCTGAENPWLGDLEGRRFTVIKL